MLSEILRVIDFVPVFVVIVICALLVWLVARVCANPTVEYTHPPRSEVPTVSGQCQHEWDSWERIPHKTHPYVIQVRECLNCGWTEKAEVPWVSLQVQDLESEEEDA